MTIHLYGIPVYKTLLHGHSNVQKEFEPFLEDSKFLKRSNDWACNVDTTFGNREADDMPWNVFIKPAMEGLNEYLETFQIDLPAEYRIECWLNRYNKGDFQEVHNHTGVSAISCAYMMKTPPGSGNFTFYNNTYDHFWQTDLPLLTTQDFKYNNRITPPLEEGEIIYFPSNLNHYVSPNNTAHTRATISANFIIKDKANA